MTMEIWLSLPVRYFFAQEEVVNNSVCLYAGGRVDNNLVDLSSRTGYSLINVKPQNARARAAEYYQVNTLHIGQWCKPKADCPNLVWLGICANTRAIISGSFILGQRLFSFICGSWIKRTAFDRAITSRMMSIKADFPMTIGCQLINAVSKRWFN